MEIFLEDTSCSWNVLKGRDEGARIPCSVEATILGCLSFGIFFSRAKTVSGGQDLHSLTGKLSYVMRTLKQTCQLIKLNTIRCQHRIQLLGFWLSAKPTLAHRSNRSYGCFFSWRKGPMKRHRQGQWKRKDGPRRKKWWRGKRGW